MPRRARMYLPGYPYHIVQRGNNRYLKLELSVEARRHADRELFRSRIPYEDVHLIECASHYSHPVGDDRFKSAD